MVCEGTWRFWGCARWPVDDGEWLKTQLTRFGVMAGAVLARRASVDFSTAPAHASGWHSKRKRICVELGLGWLWRSRDAILCTLYSVPGTSLSDQDPHFRLGASSREQNSSCCSERLL